MFGQSGYQSLDPAANRSRRKRRLLAASMVLFGLIALGSLWHTAPQVTALLLKPDTCNPYALPGMLAYEPNDPHANRWHPFAGMRDETDPELRSDVKADACAQPAPALAAAFVRASWSAVPPSLPSNESALEPDFASAALGPDGRPWEDVEFARNRTVVFLGDSISRFTTKYFCDMVGERVIELNWQHPWAPAEILKDGSTREEPERDDAHLDPFGWHLLPPADPGSHLAHYCYAPGMDFLLIHLHAYGLDEEDFWKSKPSYIPPYTFEDRVHRLVRPYLNRIRATTGRGASAPELVYVNSGMWDVMRFAHEDIAADKSIASTLGSTRLAWYRRRVRDALTFVVREFPQAAVYWSASHYPIKASNGWFFGDIKPKHRPDIKLLRLAEMHGAAMSAFEDTADASPEDKAALDRVELGRWGLAMTGQEDHQIDDLHPTFLPGGYLWADMALWDLRHEVRRRGL
ncbi:hypothetical protein CC85DRAFT_282798 [Cutaneotrichosporon oleaginosum]|uniref:Uncharacterized protein n=1 Tax=Cutaneotrichosporon oleaginosum TaxID=879819 RepID=A0A0J0XW44_9TREE|nr:uncharacterized protein CC85DRAFT_282798 [Cutaneotrichosporon oleaginosum]KLT45315.1 hypothetical protein CC85DRAFT_282798 [Cutaneotrichosporon oleaginosum]TXT14856.1 hypothetical protein COLE_01049 [Cutaneotrichosporon oleaginosum]